MFEFLKKFGICFDKPKEQLENLNKPILKDNYEIDLKFKFPWAWKYKKIDEFSYQCRCGLKIHGEISNSIFKEHICGKNALLAELKKELAVKEAIEAIKNPKVEKQETQHRGLIRTALHYLY